MARSRLISSCSCSSSALTNSVFKASTAERRPAKVFSLAANCPRSCLRSSLAPWASFCSAIRRTFSRRVSAISALCPARSSALPRRICNSSTIRSSSRMRRSFLSRMMSASSSRSTSSRLYAASAYSAPPSSPWPGIAPREISSYAVRRLLIASRLSSYSFSVRRSISAWSRSRSASTALRSISSFCLRASMVWFLRAIISLKDATDCCAATCNFRASAW
mmetsp:Transcript_9577/g.16817  ORF Transcript_9577/g.16817 Transcript_9577/m.16817 type:complete len:220 (+) Transcript_9577:1971-2630(+)